MLKTEFKNYAINPLDLKGYKIPKAVGNKVYFSSKNDFLNHPDKSLPATKEWIAWNNGQKFIATLNGSFLELNDVLKLHKILFAQGKLRTNQAETNPSLQISCEDKILNDETFDVLKDFDVKSIEGFPLLNLEGINTCDDHNYSSARLIYYKGAGIKIEVTRWLNDYNDMMARFERSGETYGISPYQYLADMQRWFLAIKPFSFGNEVMIQALIDYSLNRLRLPNLPTMEAARSVYQTVEQNRIFTLKKAEENIRFFESCLFETISGPVSNECTKL